MLWRAKAERFRSNDPDFSSLPPSTFPTRREVSSSAHLPPITGTPEAARRPEQRREWADAWEQPAKMTLAAACSRRTRAWGAERREGRWWAEQLGPMTSACGGAAEVQGTVQGRELWVWAPPKGPFPGWVNYSSRRPPRPLSWCSHDAGSWRGLSGLPWREPRRSCPPSMVAVALPPSSMTGNRKRSGEGASPSY